MKKCCLCGKKFEGYGNNPAPLTEESYIYSEKRCCDDCNSKKVIPERLKRMRKGEW